MNQQKEWLKAANFEVKSNLAQILTQTCWTALGSPSCCPRGEGVDPLR